jgi:hypothetical protein
MIMFAWHLILCTFYTFHFFCLHIMHMCVHGFIYIFFPQVAEVLSIASPIALPFQKVWANCHVVDITISLTHGVYCNAYYSKSMIQKLGFFHGSIATNDEFVLLTITGNGLKQLCVLQNLNSWIYFAQNKFNSSFQFTFMVNFACQPHLLVLAFKKTSNNLPHKQKLVRRAKL